MFYKKKIILFLYLLFKTKIYIIKAFYDNLYPRLIYALMLLYNLE
jgi:hypothetical protein